MPVCALIVLLNNLLHGLEWFEVGGEDCLMLAYVNRLCGIRSPSFFGRKSVFFMPIITQALPADQLKL